MKLHLWMGSQDLYGEKVLETVHARGGEMAEFFTKKLGVEVIRQPVLTSAARVLEATRKANGDPDCAGVIFFPHTFSPALMYIWALGRLTVPVAHLYTQYHRGIPYGTLDMDTMNLDQSAHGNREAGHGFVVAGKRSEIIAGYWGAPSFVERLIIWSRACRVAHHWPEVVVAQIGGGRMRDVAVTGGNDVAACRDFGFRVHPYDVGDVAKLMPPINAESVNVLVAEYLERYTIAPTTLNGREHDKRLREAAAIELALRQFLKETGCMACTTNFQAMTGLPQLAFISAQRLMTEGVGFAAEGDWKTAALLRALYVMGEGFRGGCSFMEQYMNDFTLGAILFAHMGEISPALTDERPQLVVSPLGIGGLADPVRLVFTVRPGPAINVSLVDPANGRFRLIVNEVDIIPPPEPMTNLPVARALCLPKPNLEVEARMWLEAGGAHHTVLSQQLRVEDIRVLARILGIDDLVVIDRNTPKS